jgi:hypothetical protein
MNKDIMMNDQIEKKIKKLKEKKLKEGKKGLGAWA